MPKIKQSPKLPPEKRREQLLAAARKLFLKKGYRGTSTDQIARQAGLTKGALYHHFRTKEDILMALMQNEGCRAGELLQALPDGSTHPVDFLRTVLGTKTKRDTSDLRNLVDFWVQGMRIPRVRKYLEDQYLLMQDCFVKKVDRSFGRTEQARRQMAEFTLAFFDGLAARSCVQSGKLNMEAQLKFFEKLLECK